MTDGWTAWRLYPATEMGGQIQAPVGPGLYEVRRVSNGDLVAFGHTANVARALLRAAPQKQTLWSSLRGRTVLPRRDLEYRICTATSTAQARAMAERLISRRQVYWRRTLLNGSPA